MGAEGARRMQAIQPSRQAANHTLETLRQKDREQPFGLSRNCSHSALRFINPFHNLISKSPVQKLTYGSNARLPAAFTDWRLCKLFGKDDI